MEWNVTNSTMNLNIKEGGVILKTLLPFPALICVFRELIYDEATHADSLTVRRWFSFCSDIGASASV